MRHLFGREITSKRSAFIRYKKLPENHWLSGSVISIVRRLTLGELGSATGCLEAVLLSFLHSGVAGQEAGGLQGAAELGVQGQQGTGDAVTDSAGLAGNAAASHIDNHIHSVNHTGGNQGLTDNELQGVQAKVLVDVAAIDNEHGQRRTYDGRCRNDTSSCSRT